MQWPLLWAGIAWIVGVLASDLLVSQPLFWWVSTIIALLLLWRALRQHYGVMVCAWLSLWAAGGLRAATYKPPELHVLTDLCPATGARWRLKIDAPVDRRSGVSQRGTTRDTQTEVLACEHNGQWLQLPAGARLRLRLPMGQTIARGDVIDVRLRVRPTDVQHNPGDLDPEYLRRHQQIMSSAVGLGPYIHQQFGTGVMAHIDRLRDACGAQLEAALPQTQAALAKALVLGDQRSLSVEARSIWADAGTAHLYSVSGLHVALVAWLVGMMATQIVGRLPLAGERYSVRRVAAATGIPALILYCTLVGASAAAVRSLVMALVVLAAQLTARRASGWNALGAAALTLALLQPSSVYDPGFLLSFVAVGGLLALPRMNQDDDATLWGKTRHLIVSALAVSAAATLTTAPITAYYFGRVSLIAPLVNLLAVPIGSTLATPLGLLFVAVQPISTTCAAWIAWGLGKLLGITHFLAEWGASFEWAAIDVPTPSACELLSYSVLILGVYLRWYKSNKAARFLALGIGAMLICGAVRVAQSHGDGKLHLWQMYVGQGDGAIVQLPRGTVMMIDAGGAVYQDGTDPGRMVMAPMLRRMNIHSIDVAVLTHPHPDHLNGLLYVAENFAIKELWISGQGEQLPSMQKLLAFVVRRGGRVVHVARLPQSIERDGVTIDILHPRPPAERASDYYPEFEMNDNSVTLRFLYGKRSLLMTGDIEHSAEHLLHSVLGPIDVLKAAHHGSKTSSTEEFVETLAPKAVIISCGVCNQFGFPHAEVSERYNAHNVAIFRSDEEGMLHLSTDGKTLELQSYTRERSLTLN